MHDIFQSDLATGSHHIPMDPKDSHKTSFLTPFGHYEFDRMPFGLKKCPSNISKTHGHCIIRTTRNRTLRLSRWYCCWSCKQRGFSRMNCRNRPRKFCSWCGTLCLRHNWDRHTGNTIALMADGTKTRLGEHLSGRMRITNRWFDVQVTTMRQMTYDVLLGIYILVPLGLTMTSNGARILPPPRAGTGAYATEGTGPSVA